MTPVARSVFYHGWYLLVLGAWLIVDPDSLLALFRLPAAQDGWIRVLGLALFVIGYFYHQAARSGIAPFFALTLLSRPLAFVVLTLLVVFRFVPAVVFVFGLVELLGAAWTWRAMRRA